MRKISRRNFLLTAGVVSAAALLAACGNSASAVSSESASCWLPVQLPSVQR